MRLSREEYKNIKKFNKEQLERYLTNIYTQGHNAGVEALSKKITPVIDRGVRNAPGVGEKRYNQIMDSINAEIELAADE